MTGTASAPVLVDKVDDHIWVFTLNRPRSRNAVDGEMANRMEEYLLAFDADAAARVGIVVGAGTGFCAGLDLKAFVDSGELGETPEGGFCGFTRRGSVKPLIAAVEGYALAGGLEVALACDLLVVADDARLGIPEVRRGLVADGGALMRLPRDLPYRVAMEMALCGREVPVRRLYQLGLVNHVTAPGEALTSATQLAQAIAANAPLAVVATKQIVASSGDWPADERWDRQDHIARPVWDSRDAQEGALAFAERRPATFEGR
jgi:enoyl-CoA hydratase